MSYLLGSCNIVSDNPVARHLSQIRRSLYLSLCDSSNTVIVESCNTLIAPDGLLAALEEHTPVVLVIEHGCNAISSDPRESTADKEFLIQT